MLSGCAGSKATIIGKTLHYKSDNCYSVEFPFETSVGRVNEKYVSYPDAKGARPFKWRFTALMSDKYVISSLMNHILDYQQAQIYNFNVNKQINNPDTLEYILGNPETVISKLHIPKEKNPNFNGDFLQGAIYYMSGSSGEYLSIILATPFDVTKSDEEIKSSEIFKQLQSDLSFIKNTIVIGCPVNEQ